MALQDDIPALLAQWRAVAPTMAHNAELFDIHEGLLADYVLKDLAKQLQPQSYERVKHRLAPINVLRQLIEKLSKIYSKPPHRILSIDSQTDKELLAWYERCYTVNTTMGIGNEFFNLFKNTAIEPYVHNRKPALRTIPSDRFFVYSNDPVDPTNPTHFVKLMGKITRTVKGKSKTSAATTEIRDLFYTYTKDQFLPIDDKGEVVEEILIQYKNPQGINPYGRLPVVYVNRSRHALIPPIDTDTLRMTKIFPILLSDINYAVMMQSFSIIYGINIDEGNMTMSPDSFWRFKSDPSSNQPPEIGSIKPQVDIAEVIGLIMAQLSFWLQSRGIRPGAIGQVTSENFASGVSKIVDEMDTFEDRQKQVPYFVKAEEDLWSLTIEAMHPVWVREGLIDEKRLFSGGQQVLTIFPEQKPMVRRADVLAEVEKEIAIGMTTRKKAYMRLNPDSTEEEAEYELEEIEEENEISSPSDETSESSKHTHEMPNGEMTGPDVGSGTGEHYHSVPGGQTSRDEYGPGHTHTLPNGEETGPPEEADDSED